MPNYIDQIEKAIQDHKTGTDFDTALTGGLWNGTVPDCGGAPYGLLEWVGIKDISTFTEINSKGQVQFQFWGTKSEVNELIGLCEAAYHDCAESPQTIIAPSGFFNLQRENVIPAFRETKKRDYKWTGWIDFRIKFTTKIQ